MPDISNDDEKNTAKIAINSKNIPLLEKAPEKIEISVLELIPEQVARKNKMAVFEKEKNLIKVAMVDPEDLEALNILRFIAEEQKTEIEIYLATHKVYKDIIDQYKSAEEAVEEVVESLKDELTDSQFFSKEKKEEAKEAIQDAPVTKLVQVIIRHAVDGRASDVHIEPIEGKYRVRFRVDGILHSSLVLPDEVGRAVVARVKILSNLKIDEKRKPQDGRFKLEGAEAVGNSVDFRVSTLPVVEGEKVVMRVLDKSQGNFDLMSLGIMGRNYEVMMREIKNPFGIILMTGPTGSGKSTTLYGFLQILNKEERNIITLEDPVEYYVEGVNQSQIKPEIGYTFANGLRSILRQDPNIIMVGEIRDSETAELAIHAALTGHLVFSTLHTNDSIGAIPRLIDMGIEPFLVAYSLRVTAAQRLVRKICEKCNQEKEMPPNITQRIKDTLKNVTTEELKKYGINSLEKLKFYEGKGCEACGRTGYKGRIAICEVLELNESIQQVILENGGSEVKLRDEAEKQGMLTMKQDGFLKVLKGMTTLAEVERLTEGSRTVGGDTEDDKG